MARNLYFSEAVRSEQRLYEDIIIESLKMYGQDLYYLPRTIVNENRIFGEDVPSKFNNSYKIEMPHLFIIFELIIFPIVS